MALFEAGQVVSTREASDTIPEILMIAALARHLNGDWGIVSRADKTANNQALRDGGRLFSAYRMPDGTKFWIITEADRSITTIMLPEDY